MSSTITEQAQMVEILRFEELPGKAEVTPKLEYERFQRIINDPRWEKLPFFVMSLTGRKRNGKSFLTNLLISKFGFQEKNRYRNCSWIESNETVEGVEWKQDRDSVTKGIWVWSQPLIVTTKSDQKVAVVLLDCQGLYDPATHQETVDALITLYFLELSKLQIFNSKGDIDAADLQHLESSISFAGMTGLSLMFNSLVLLHRDWQMDKLYGSRGSYFENMKAKRKLNKCEKAVEEAFVETAEYTMPIPGSNICSANVGDKMKLQELRKQKESAAFLNWVDQFGDFIMEKYVTKPQNLYSRGQLLILIERIKRHVQDESSHYTFHSSAEVLERKLVLSFFEEVEDEILPSMAVPIHVKSYKSNQEGNMLQHLQQAENTVKEYFRQKQKEHQTHTELGLKTWEEVNEKVEKWFAALRELKLLEFKRILDKEKIRALIMGLSIAGATALCVATGGIALCVSTGGTALGAVTGNAALGVATGGTALGAATGGTALGVATGGTALGVATGGTALGVATGGTALGVATGGTFLGVVTGSAALGAVTGGTALGAATGGTALGAATGGAALGTATGGIAVCVSTSGIALGVATGGTALGAATGSAALGAATGATALGVATGSTVLGVATGSTVVGAATGGTALGAAAAGAAVGVATGGTAVGAATSGAALGAATGGIGLVIKVKTGAVAAVAAAAAAGGAAGLVIGGAGVGIGVGVENIKQRLKDCQSAKLLEKKKK